jgi:hypothetical protein
MNDVLFAIWAILGLGLILCLTTGAIKFTHVKDNRTAFCVVVEK